MPSAVYLHDSEKQITLRFPTEEDRERFKAHYRLLDSLGVQYRTERDEARAVLATRDAEIKRLRDALEIEELALMGADLYSSGPPSPEERLTIIRAALSAPQESGG